MEITDLAFIRGNTTMSRIPMQHRGKRPRFFSVNGMDELMSMVLELTAELWIIKKRLYLLERVAANKGVDLTPDIENYALSDQEVKELDSVRREMIATVLRSLENEYSNLADIRDETLATGDPDKNASVRAA
jgi:hypothetical protein